MTTLLEAIAKDRLEETCSRQTIDRATELVAAGRVTRPRIGERRASMFVVDDRGRRTRAAIALGPNDRPCSTCACGARGRRLCVHAAALVLLLAGGAAPTHARGASESEDDEQALPEQPQAERQRRIERGRSGLFTVAPLGRRSSPYGEYRVSSPSGQEYLVAIRALDAPHNGCACHDFRVNRLGTCKHIEAALHHF